MPQKIPGSPAHPSSIPLLPIDTDSSAERSRALSLHGRFAVDDDDDDDDVDDDDDDDVDDDTREEASGESMPRSTRPSLRSSPSFGSPSYGAMTATTDRAADSDTGHDTDSDTLGLEAPATSEVTHTSATNSAQPSRQGTLRSRRSQATSLRAQYDAVTGGSMRVPPPELEVEVMLAGLGGSRFDVAGTAAPVSAVPSEASFDEDEDDEEYEDSEDGDAEENHKGKAKGVDGRLESCGSSSGRIRRPSTVSSRNGGTYVVAGLADDDSDEDDDDDNDDDNKASTSGMLPPPDDSPFAQVRASVAPVDNTLLSISTPRMWCLAMLFSVLGSSTNLFFSLRYPSVAITPVIALLLVHPLGLGWDMLLKRADDPPEEFVDGLLVRGAGRNAHHCSRWTRARLWLAQGRWNEKEHTCVYVGSNVSFGFAFATDVVVEQTHFYKQQVTVTYQLLLIVSTQVLGYAFAGLARRFLVRPSGMIWPATLMSASMFATLHKEENRPANGWRISRWKFFYAVFACAFAFYFLPGLLMPALSYCNVLTWFAPDNVVVANLFGVVSGLGLFPLTFDWAQIAYIGSPLLTPFWAAMNVAGGLVVVMWVLAPLAYYANWLYASYMPILSTAVFDNRGEVYDVGRILTPDFVLDRAAYAAYSRVFLPITYVLSYGVQFAGLASLLTHTACWHGRDIWRQWRMSWGEASAAKTNKTSGGVSGGVSYQPVAGTDMDADGDNPSAANLAHTAVPLQPAASLGDANADGLLSREDVHNRLMQRYRDAPMWWYLATFVSMTGVGMFLVEYYPVHLPWYGLLLALAICAVLFIPIGIIMAVTNQQVSIYLLCQLVCGAVFPGRPVANMVFVTYGYISSAQGIKFCADMKLGHYMKIPPRVLFQVQMAATLVSSATQIGVLNWMFAHVPGLCTPEALNGFTCPIARVHFNGSILWGVVGPGAFFGRGAVYRPLVWCFFAGAVAPVPLWLYARRRKDSLVRKINLPIVLGSLGWIPPATGLNFSVWALVCFVFNYVVKRRATAWWAKYTMTLSAALDAALASGIVVVFFAFVYPGLADRIQWWGTEVYRQGCDWRACAYREVPPGGRFGPETW